MKRAILLLATGAIFSGAGCDRAKLLTEKLSKDSEAVEQPLYPFDLFFTPESVTAPRVSPDGSQIAFIAPVEGVNNFFVAPIDDVDDARQLTHFEDAGVRATDVSGNVMYRWSIDGGSLIFPKDYDGNENWDIWVADIDTGEARNITPSPDRKIQIMQLSQDDPQKIAISDAAPGIPLPDVYSLDLKTGEKELLIKNDMGMIGFLVDRSLNPAAGVGYNPNGSLQFYSFKSSDAPQLIEDIQPEDTAALSATVFAAAFMVAETNNNLYRFDSVDKNTNALVRVDLATGEKTEIAIDPRVDITDVLYDPENGSPIGFSAMWDRLRWTALDEQYADDFAAIAAYQPLADYYIQNVSRDKNIWIIRYMESNKASVYVAYDREDKSITELFVGTPQLEGMEFELLHPYEMKSDDGLEYVSYYMLPSGADPDGDGRPEKPAPMVMIVHGGPSDERAIYAFGPMLHWLANRGYGALYVNYRGSAGFGKAFMNAGKGEWGGKMHQDLIDQVNWAVDEKIADPDRIAIMGGSYGGYATLVGMTMTPEVFACGIDIVGPSNLSIPMPHWSPDWMKETLGGDPRTEEGKAFLLSRSPSFYAGQTKNPVLIGQGDQDSRVPTSQSDEIVDKMVQAGAAVTYIRFPDEGHGFARRENNRAFWGVAEVFLSECLGGRAEPIGDKLEGSSIIAPAGAEHVPGMEEALAALSAE